MQNLNLKLVNSTFVHQHDASDCGIACLLSLIKFYGGDNSIIRLRELSGTSQYGTSLLGLYQTAKTLGFETEGVEADINSLIEHGKPVILHIIQNKTDEHFVVCYGYNGKNFIIGNPANAIENWSIEYLESVWRSKCCLTLCPTESFKRKKSISREKKTWFLNLIKADINILLISLFIGIIIAALGMTMAVFSQKLIDDIIPSKDYRKLWVGISLLILLLSGKIGFFALRQYLLLRQGKDLNNRIIDLFYGNLLFLPKAFFDNRKIGDIVARLNDTRRIQNIISRIIGEVVIDILITLISLCFLFFYSYEIALVAIFALLPLFLIIFKSNQRIIKAQYDAMTGYALSESNFINTIQGVSTIKIFNKQSVFSQLNKNIYGLFQENVFSLGMINIKLGWLSGLCSIVFIGLILILGVILVLNDKMKLGELMAILTISGSLLPSIVSLALVAIPYNEAKVAFNRIFEFIGIKPEFNINNIESNIEFKSLKVKNLSFRYPGKSCILKDLSFMLSKGEIVSIIGESGCGKSTLCQILSKFYDSESGEVIINNRLPFNNIETQRWRDIISVTSQEVFIFNGTVLENIAMDEISNPESVIEFCKLHGFDAFFKILPQGYYTIIGEDGINLSGGQKQLISLARAIFKKPQLLVLDESTSSMDCEMESFVLKLLVKLKSEAAILFISHRLHILRKICERIYILDSGKIVQFGSHEDLMRSNNLYRKYWDDFSNQLSNKLIC